MERAFVFLMLAYIGSFVVRACWAGIKGYSEGEELNEARQRRESQARWMVIYSALTEADYRSLGLTPEFLQSVVGRANFKLLARRFHLDSRQQEA